MPIEEAVHTDWACAEQRPTLEPPSLRVQDLANAVRLAGLKDLAGQSRQFLLRCLYKVIEMHWVDPRLSRKTIILVAKCELASA